MYAVIRHYHFDKSKSEETNHKVQEVLVPTVRKVNGFVTYYLVGHERGRRRFVERVRG